MISRRHILKSGALVAFGSFLPGWARRAMAEDAPASRKVLVFLFLRGALDGLHAVTPIGEPRFAQLRPQPFQYINLLLACEPRQEHTPVARQRVQHAQFGPGRLQPLPIVRKTRVFETGGTLHSRVNPNTCHTMSYEYL